MPSGFDPTLIALSPDGKKLVFVGRAAEGTQLYLREMDGLEITPIAGTEGAQHPFFSPDSNWVGFLTEDRVKKISLRGGGPITLCAAPTLLRATWTHDDMIYFGSDQGRVLNSVPASGGVPTTIFDMTSFEGTLGEILPDGQSALVMIQAPNSVNDDFSSIYALSLETLEKKLLIEGVTTPAMFPPVICSLPELGSCWPSLLILSVWKFKVSLKWCCKALAWSPFSARFK